MSNPAISVVTAACDPGPDLVGTAASLRDQSLRDFEWIIVDDASAGEHAQHFEEAAWVAGVPVTVLRQVANGGQAAARNRGFAAARGAYVKVVDADDSLDRRHLENLLDAAGRQENGALVFAPTRHLFIGSARGFVNTTYERAGTTPLDQLAALLVTPFLTHCGVLFPRPLLERLGGYDETLRSDEDGDLLIRVLLSGRRFVPVPASTYIYRHDVTRSRVSRDDSREKLGARLRVCEKVIEHFRDSGVDMPDGLRHALARRMDAIALRAWHSEPGFARLALRRARETEPAYVPSGPRLARVLRRVIGIGPTLRLMRLARALRPRMV